MLGPIDSWSGIVWVGFLKIGRVNHNPAVYGYLDRLALAYVEGVPSVLTVVNAHQGHKFSTAADEMSQYLVLARVVLEREGVERVDLPCSTELWNAKLH